MDEGKCVGKVAFEIKDGKVISYVNGKRVPDRVPARARIILFQFLNKAGTPVTDVLVDHRFVEQILQLDAIATTEIVQEWEDRVCEDEEDDGDFSEYMSDILIYLHNHGLVRCALNENLIRQILYATDVVVLNSVAI